MRDGTQLEKHEMNNEPSCQVVSIQEMVNNKLDGFRGRCETSPRTTTVMIHFW
jgi:hypothetical protein